MRRSARLAFYASLVGVAVSGAIAVFSSQVQADDPNFDQNGKFIAEWKQFGRPSGIYIRSDIIYVADSQSSDKVNAPFKQGIRIGSVKDGKVTAFIPQTDPKEEMPEAVTADKDGNIFGGFTANTDVKEFVKK